MKRSLILLSLLVALIPSSANSWGVMGMSGVKACSICPGSATAPFTDIFDQCYADGTAPCTGYWSSRATYYGATFADGTYFYIKNNMLELYGKSSSGVCYTKYVSATYMPAAGGRYASVTSSSWNNITHNQQDIVRVELVNSGNIADYNGWGPKNVLTAQVYWSTTGTQYYATLIAWDTSKGQHVLGSGTLGTNISGTHTLKIVLDSSTTASLYWDSTAKVSAANFSSYATMGSNIYGGLNVGIGNTSSFVTLDFTSFYFQ